MNTRMKELFKIIESAKGEMDEIYRDCSHENYRVGFWPWSYKHKTICRICSDCCCPLPKITQEEINEFEHRADSHSDADVYALVDYDLTDAAVMRLTDF